MHQSSIWKQHPWHKPLVVRCQRIWHRNFRHLRQRRHGEDTSAMLCIAGDAALLDVENILEHPRWFRISSISNRINYIDFLFKIQNRLQKTHIMLRHVTCKKQIPCINLCFHFCIRMISTNPLTISHTTAPPAKGVKLTHTRIRNPLLIWKNLSFLLGFHLSKKKKTTFIQGTFCPRHRDLDPKPLPIPNVWRELPPSHPRPEAWFFGKRCENIHLRFRIC